MDTVAWRVSWIQTPLAVVGTLVGLLLAVAIAVAFHARSDLDDLTPLPLYGYSVILLGLAFGTFVSGTVLSAFVRLMIQTRTLSGRVGLLVAGVLIAAGAAIATTSIVIGLGTLVSGFWGMS